MAKKEKDSDMQGIFVWKLSKLVSFEKEETPNLRPATAHLN
jgi:hypothetical protein